MKNHNSEAEKRLIDEILLEEAAEALAASRRAGLEAMRRRRRNRMAAPLVAIAAAILLTAGFYRLSPSLAPVQQLTHAPATPAQLEAWPAGNKKGVALMSSVRIERHTFLVPVKISSSSELVACRQLTQVHGVRPRSLSWPGDKPGKSPQGRQSSSL